MPSKHICLCGKEVSPELQKEINKKFDNYRTDNWIQIFPLNTFRGKTKQQLIEFIDWLLETTATRTRQEDIETINKLAPLASIGFNGETHYLISRAEAINSLNK